MNFVYLEKTEDYSQSPKAVVHTTGETPCTQ